MGRLASMATLWASIHKINDKTCEIINNIVYHTLSTLSTLNVKSRHQYKAVYHNCQITKTVSLSTRGVLIVHELASLYGLQTIIISPDLSNYTHKIPGIVSIII